MVWTIAVEGDTDVPPPGVFRFYADPSTWGSWGHNTRWGKAEGPLAPGSIVYVKAGYGTVYAVRVQRFEPDRLVECEVRPRGMRVVNRYLVEPRDGGSRLRHEIEVSGPLARVTRVLLAGLYTRLLGKEMRKLVALARSTDQSL